RSLSGALPPLGEKDWRAAFAGYQAIPQFRLVNPGMTLDQFKFIYWWEWAHRLLARLLGAVFLIPFTWFAIRRELPRRLWWQFGAIFVLIGLEPIVGWWMVASGLETRVYV